MIRPQFSLRSLVGALTLAACLLGIGIPAYREHQRQRIVKLIRVEVEKGLADAQSQMIDNPEHAELDVKVLQDIVRRAPALNDAERREFEPKLERIIKECARRSEIEQSERWMYACRAWEKSSEPVATGNGPGAIDDARR